MPGEQRVRANCQRIQRILKANDINTRADLLAGYNIDTDLVKIEGLGPTLIEQLQGVVSRGSKLEWKEAFPDLPWE
jgi:hypothetical protein